MSQWLDDWRKRLELARYGDPIVGVRIGNEIVAREHGFVSGDGELAGELRILCGLPRSGKTTTGKQLQAAGWVRLCPDDIRRALHGEQFIAEAEPFVWAICETTARALLLGLHRVVIDATNTTRARREQWVRLAAEFGIRLQIEIVPTPLRICLERNHGDNALPDAVIERMARQWERPTADEGQVYELVQEGLYR